MPRSTATPLIETIVLLAIVVAGAGAGWATRPMLEVRSGDALLEGAVLAESGRRVEFLARDGRLWELDAKILARAKKLPMRFRSASYSEIRAALERELDGQLDVGGTSHFVVACPRGHVERWSQRFEDLFRSFRHYFAVRGLEPREPEFPLIAVVWPDQTDFLRHARQDGHNIGPGVLGFYSPQTNRVSLFDQAVFRGQGWEESAAVIIHEATHQSAFNTGLHNRFAPPPRWLAEGLGMMFEAPGVWNSERFPRLESRVNRQRLASFRYHLAHGRRAQTWLALVGSDAMFQRDAQNAYAESWAFTFFLAETYGAKYNALLKRVAAKPDFSVDSAATRLADFKGIFDEGFDMVEARFLRFVAELR